MSTSENMRPGVVVDPVARLTTEQIANIHQASMQILQDPGILCFNDQATERFKAAGCPTERSERDDAWVVRIPSKLVSQAVESAPSRVVLGARDKRNSLVIDANVPRVYFGTGSETNLFLESEIHEFVSTKDDTIRQRHPVFRPERGSLKRLCDSARLCDALPNVDFFIRNVNVQDDLITPDNRDVNIFFASLLHLTRHVQAGLAEINALDRVIRLGEIVAGSPEAFRQRPVLSFIACPVKSPLQMVEDTTHKVMAIAERGLPQVISSSPQGGSTAPVQEEGMVALINAEILAGITLTQLVNPSTPVLYGAVPVRARLDTLHDLYGSPDFIHYNVSCVQMARFYRLPGYSSAGVGDADQPGVMATIEKLPAQLSLALAGAQYIHYAFGLLERTNTFCPLQAVLDDANVGVIKQIIRRPAVGEDACGQAVREVRKVMLSSTRLFARHIRKHLRRGVVSPPHPLESEASDDVLLTAQERLDEIRNGPGNRLDDATVDALYEAGLGLVPREHFDL